MPYTGFFLLTFVLSRQLQCVCLLIQLHSSHAQQQGAGNGHNGTLPIILGIAVFHLLAVSHDPKYDDIMKNVLSMLAATLASITGFYFGGRSAEQKTPGVAAGGGKGGGGGAGGAGGGGAGEDKAKDEASRKATAASEEAKQRATEEDRLAIAGAETV